MVLLHQNTRSDILGLTLMDTSTPTTTTPYTVIDMFILFCLLRINFHRKNIPNMKILHIV